MTDLEINKALALAIGWKPDQLEVDVTNLYICVDKPGYIFSDRLFDYRDWYVIGPIAEKFDCFPEKDVYDQWVAGEYPYAMGDTPQKAIALAAIGGVK